MKTTINPNDKKYFLNPQFELFPFSKSRTISALLLFSPFSTLGIPLDDFVYYIIIPVSGFLVLIILILLCFLICACCIIRSMKTKTVEVREGK